MAACVSCKIALLGMCLAMVCVVCYVVRDFVGWLTVKLILRNARCNDENTEF